ncbi:MAG: hypothetical protein R2682_07510 [Pyrinomonadaceae bacterium]
MIDVEEAHDTWSLEDIDRKMSSKNQALIDTQDGLSYLSEETGGFTIKNPLTSRKASARSSTIRAITSWHTNRRKAVSIPKLRFNKIEIKVDRPGTGAVQKRLLQRRRQHAERQTWPTPFQSIADALLSPFAQNDLPIRYNGLFNYDHKNGAYLRSLVHMNIADLDFKTLPDGKRQASLDIFAYLFGVNGAIEGRLQKTYKLTVPPEAFEAAFDRIRL